MSLEVLEPGFLTTVQDLGRFGYQRLGIPAAGAMDGFALMAANALVGNEWGAAGLEVTVSGPSIAFHEACVIAVTGADLAPRVDGREVRGWRSYLVRRGSLLEFSGRRSGARAYVAVSGGIAVEPWLGSRSTYLLAGVGGLDGRALWTGDRLPVGKVAVALAAVAGQEIPWERRPAYAAEPTVRVILGPHLERFTEAGVNAFLSGSYRVTPASNRMGYRLEGPIVSHSRDPDLVSCGVPLGGIQVPGDGQPIVLMADHQTTGGYTIVATAIRADLPLLAQCLPGDRVRFRAVGLGEARDAWRRVVDGVRVAQQEGETSLWQI